MITQDESNQDDNRSNPYGDKRLLIIDDEQFNRTLLRRHLTRVGFEHVMEAKNGQEGLEVLRNNHIDLVMSDINMPMMTGKELLEAMKLDMRLSKVPVIIISSDDHIAFIAECIEIGAEDYLLKPFDPVLLRARVTAGLEKKRLLDQEKQYRQTIREEKKRGDDLINVILPTPVANELKKNGRVEPRRYDNVAVLFCDIVGFTEYCDAHAPEEVVSNLQSLFEKFEEIVLEHRMEKIKTIGDEFMAASGLILPEADPLDAAVRCGLKMAEAATEILPEWSVRIGVHVGPVVAGVVGRQKYLFDVWGATVNMASRMTSQANPGTVAIMEELWHDIEDSFEAQNLGLREVKGKGDVYVIACYKARED